MHAHMHVCNRQTMVSASYMNANHTKRPRREIDTPVGRYVIARQMLHGIHACGESSPNDMVHMLHIWHIHGM